VSVKITGLRSTQQALRLLAVNFRTIRGKALINFSNEVVKEAQKFCGVDTGALQASIGHKPTKIEKDIIQEEVYAGHPNFVRGEGKYLKGRDNKTATRKPTEEYAHIHEKQSKFMESAFSLGKAKITRYITNAINDAIRSTI